MIFCQQRIIRSVVPLLLFSIFQVYIQASLTIRETPTRHTQIPMVGRLEIHGKQYILVDTNKAESGATILDDQTLETSNCVSGTVHLLPVGLASGTVDEQAQVDLSVDARAVINYSAGKVKVALMGGCARVQTALNIDATIDTPDGSSMPAAQRDTADRKRAEVCYPAGEKRDFRPSCGVSPAIYGALAAGGAAALALVALNRPCNRALDTSTGIPTGPCR